jgi:hypothetical protein
MHLPIGLGASIAQSFDEELPVVHTAKYRFPVVAPVHHVIDGSFELQSEFSRHENQLFAPAGNCQSRS